MYEPAPPAALTSQSVTLGRDSTPAPEHVGGLEGEPELDPVGGRVQVAAGQLGDPADAVAQGVAVHGQGPGGRLPVAVVLQERPQTGHQVAVLAAVVVEQGAEQPPGDGLQGRILLAGQQQPVAAQVGHGGHRDAPGAGRAAGPRARTAAATASAASRATSGPAASNRATTAASWTLHTNGPGRRDSRSWTSSRRASTAPSERSGPSCLATSTAIAGEPPRPRKRRRRRISEADSSPSSRASRKSPTSRRSVLATAWALDSSRAMAVARWWTTTWWNGSGRGPRCRTRNPAGPPPTSTGSRVRLPPSSDRLSENSLPSGRRAWISAQTSRGGSTATAPRAAARTSPRTSRSRAR